MTSTEPAGVVLTERRGAALLVTINRPERLNVINTAVATALGAALETAEADPQVRALVLTGAGPKAFSAGADLEALAAGELLRSAAPGADRWGFAGVVRHYVSTPVIVAVNGAALGGGTELVLAADLAIAAPHAVFGLPEARFGVYAGGGGAFRLPAQLPPKIAMEAMLTGRTIDAAEAARWGLVNQVDADPVAAALALAERIAACAPLSVAASKRIARGLEYDAGVLACPEEESGWARTEAEGPAVLGSADCAEGVAAFKEKRRPTWRGQ
jgi:crotonobetainyl-CoA hydratase